MPLIFSACSLFPSKLSLAYLEANKASRTFRIRPPYLLLLSRTRTPTNIKQPLSSKFRFGLVSIIPDNSSRALPIVLATEGTRIVVFFLRPIKYGRGCRGYFSQEDWKSIVQAYTKEEEYFVVLRRLAILVELHQMILHTGCVSIWESNCSHEKETSLVLQHCGCALQPHRRVSI